MKLGCLQKPTLMSLQLMQKRRAMSPRQRLLIQTLMAAFGRQQHRF